MPSDNAITVTAATDPASPTPGTDPSVRTRRSLLAAALGGLTGAVAMALGRPSRADAAAGDSLKLGQQNFAGTAATRLNTTSSGGAFWMTQFGSGSGVRGDAPGGHGGVFTTQHADRNGLLAQQNAAGSGTGAAIRAIGGSNTGVDATTEVSAQSDATSAAIVGSATSTEGYTFGVYGVSAGSGGTGVYGHSTTSSTAGTGVVGVADAEGGGYGGRFIGSTGLLAVGTGTAGRAAEFEGPIVSFGEHWFLPMGDPTTASGARLYARKNGSDKVELCVVFPTGDVHILATEA